MIDDDIFLGRPTKPSFFFQDGKPHVWRKAPTWGYFAGNRCHRLYENKGIVKFPTPNSAAPSPHFWYPQLRSVCESTERQFPEFYAFVGSHKDGRFWSRSKLPGGMDERENSQEEDVQGWLACQLLQAGQGEYKNIDHQRHVLWDEVAVWAREESEYKAEFKRGVGERVAFMNFNGKHKCIDDAHFRADF
jgi:hypothetical protein